jgi:hypothetical protein
MKGKYEIKMDYDFVIEIVSKYKENNMMFLEIIILFKQIIFCHESQFI